MRAPHKSALSQSSATEVHAGTVGPMDIPTNSPIPIWRLKSRECLRRKANSRHRRRMARLLGYELHPPVRSARYQRSRSSHGLPVAALMDKLQSLQDMNEESHVGKKMRMHCTCRSCAYLRRWSSTLQPYCCTNKNCRIKFDSFTGMYEHQLDVHGGIDPRANRVVEDVFHQQQGTLAFPPATVYAAQQYMVPTRPPVLWKSMKELHEEAKVVRDKLWDYNRYCYETPFKLFDFGYQLVKRNGWKEMQRQYQIAMEHFYSAMKFPASSRGFHDGCPSVERGRNWLTSTDREDSRFLQPFSLGDRMNVEREFVLIDTKRDQEMEEMYMEISDESDHDDAYGNNKCFKNDTDDVDVQASDFTSVKERKVFDSDDDVELNHSEADEGEGTSEQNIFDIDSDITVKSEVASDSEDDADEVKAEDSDSDSESNLSQHDDSDSDDEDDDTVKNLKDEDTSASDSDEEQSAKGLVLHQVSSSEDSDSESESTVSQSGTKFASDSDSEASNQEPTTSSLQDIFNHHE